MTAKSCKTCDYFDRDQIVIGEGNGWCWWASRNPVPMCFSPCECETWEDLGTVCPCWERKSLASRIEASHE